VHFDLASLQCEALNTSSGVPAFALHFFMHGAGCAVSQAVGLSFPDCVCRGNQFINACSDEIQWLIWRQKSVTVRRG